MTKTRLFKGTRTGNRSCASPAGRPAKVLVELGERSPADGDEVDLGVEPGRHGEAGDGQSRRQVAHGHEVVAEDVGYGGPLGGVVLEQLGDQVLCERPHPGGHVVLVPLDARVGVLERLRLEGRLAHQQRVQDTPQRPDVHLVAVALLAQHLWGDVVRGAAQGPLALPVVVNPGGEAEVAELHLV